MPARHYDVRVGKPLDKAESRTLLFGESIGVADNVNQLLQAASDLDLTLESSVTKDDITWTFDDDYLVGQYVNGDYFVVGPVTITHIDPPYQENVASSIGTHPWINGSMIDPDWGSHGYHGEPSGASSSLIVGDVLPLTITPEGGVPKSLISSDGYVEPPTNHDYLRPALRSAAILTVVDPDNLPNEGDFRPNYCVGDKISMNWAEVDMSLLPSVTPFSFTAAADEVVDGETPPTASSVAADFNRSAWLQHAGVGPVESRWSRNLIMPDRNTWPYGGHLGLRVGRAAVLLCCDIPQADKEPIVRGLIQQGIDYYSLLLRDAGWVQHTEGQGGWMSGNQRFLILFAAVMTNNAAMKAVGSTYNMRAHFATGNNTYWHGIDFTDSNVPDGPYSPDPASPEPVERPIGSAVWGSANYYEPLDGQYDPDGAGGGNSYRRTWTSGVWSGAALWCWLVKEHTAGQPNEVDPVALWGYDPYFDYEDHYIKEQEFRIFTGNSTWQWSQPVWVARMYREHRNTATQGAVATMEA